MTDPKNDLDLTDPWLVAVWPGMGNVALAGGSYLIEKLGALPLADLRMDRHFDVDRVRIEEGVVVPARMPRNQFYGWKNPNGRDLVIFLGEAQPAAESYVFCNTLLKLANEFGIKRVFTFASLVTPTPPGDASRVFTVATSKHLLKEVQEESGKQVATLKDGEIVGLNGTLLAAAAANGQEAIGFLGEVPQIATNLPYLKATKAVLELFCELAGIELDFADLAEQATRIDKGLTELMAKLEKLRRPGLLPGPQGDWVPDPSALEKALEEAVEETDQDELDELDQETETSQVAETSGGLTAETLALIESLFLGAQDDREKAMELKEVLDRYGVFQDYEDRFLDLFRKSI